MLYLTRLLPAPLHRQGLRLAHAIRIRWWRIRRAEVIGCSIVAVNNQGEVLLVRHSYGTRSWMLPGGGVGRSETPIAAASRELAEETACTLTRPVQVETTRSSRHGTLHVVHVIAGHTSDTPCADGREIVAVRCFAPNDLPRKIRSQLAANLPIWMAQLASE